MQTILHCMVSTFVIIAVIFAWNIKNPLSHKASDFTGMFLSIVLFPLYQLINPQRGDAYFRLNSLFDSHKFLFMEVMGIQLVNVFLVIIFLTLVVFIIQEMIPLLMSLLQNVRADTNITNDFDKLDSHLKDKLRQAIDELALDEQIVIVFDEDDLEIFSSTGLRPKIYLSTGILQALEVRHLKSALAHEIGHIARTRFPLLVFVYIIRLMMFYNPFAMIAFRKAVNEEEKICDDIASKN